MVQDNNTRKRDKKKDVNNKRKQNYKIQNKREGMRVKKISKRK